MLSIKGRRFLVVEGLGQAASGAAAPLIRALCVAGYSEKNQEGPRRRKTRDREPQYPPGLPLRPPRDHPWADRRHVHGDAEARALDADRPRNAELISRLKTQGHSKSSDFHRPQALLGGAAVHRCDNWLFSDPASAAEVTTIAQERPFPQLTAKRGKAWSVEIFMKAS